MRRSMLALGVVVLAAGVVVSLAAGSGSSGRWVVRDLGVLPAAKGLAFNGRGQVAGEREVAGGWGRGFLWQNGRTTDLGTLGGGGSGVVDINDRGQVIGDSDTTEKDGYDLPVSHGFLWERGKIRDLGTLGGVAQADSDVADINERGQVVGTSATKRAPVPPSASDRAFLWENGRMVNLGTFGGRRSGAVAINERGQVVGFTDGGPAFLWQNGRLRGIGDGFPEAINDRGQVLITLYVGDEDFDTRAVVWQNGRRRDLGTLGGKYTGAVAMNERGQVIGWSLTASSTHPFLWSGGRMIDLGAPGGRSSESQAITLNDRGQVVLSVYRWKPNPCPAGDQCLVVWENGKVTALPDLPRAKSRTTPVLFTNSGRIFGWADPAQGEPHAVLWTKTG